MLFLASARGGTSHASTRSSRAVASAAPPLQSQRKNRYSTHLRHRSHRAAIIFSNHLSIVAQYPSTLCRAVGPPTCIDVCCLLYLLVMFSQSVKDLIYFSLARLVFVFCSRTLVLLSFWMSPVRRRSHFFSVFCCTSPSCAPLLCLFSCIFHYSACLVLSPAYC